MILNCAINSIAPFSPTTATPWNARRIAHLYRRLGFGATYDEIQAALNMSPSELVNVLLDGAASSPLPTPPTWANWTMADYNGDVDLFFQHQTDLQTEWMTAMAAGNIRSRFALFWHNHFVTAVQNYSCNNYLWTYYSLLNEYAFGNFRTFTEEIGKCGAMLSYLNGNDNIADEPNENYARELMELFTLGESNGYTQEDIVEVARALTGWQADDYECTAPFFDASLFDGGMKTIFGESGNWNYDDVHELIFTMRRDQVAYFICEKIYKHFVYPEVNTDIINQMATTFKDNNFELLPVLKQLFKSEHFFDETLIGSRIKDPVECFATISKPMNLVVANDYTDDPMGDLVYFSMLLGQELFNPIDVAGWQGHRDWINENTLAFRWSFVSDFFYSLNDTGKTKLRDLAVSLSPSLNNPREITEAVANHFIGIPLEEQHLDIAVEYFKSDIPQNYFDDGSWNLYWNESANQLINLLGYLVRLPEFQLS
ncbi:MAG TPA: DUF1800 domain-containing protein [Phaeodactylibacter sp.]|nr:DUF1800 domain-containing protein [Phaeodactylibacter sp.]